MDSVNTNDRHSLMSGFSNQIPCSYFVALGSYMIVCIRMRRSDSTQGQFSTLNTEHLHPLYLPQPSEWAKNAWLQITQSSRENDSFNEGRQLQSRAKTSLFLVKCAFICSRGSRLTRRVSCDGKNDDFDVQTTERRNSTLKFRFHQLLIDLFSVVILNMD